MSEYGKGFIGGALALCLGYYVVVWLGYPSPQVWAGTLGVVVYGIYTGFRE